MKFSVITVSYNALTDLRKTVASVLAQTDTDLEYIIVDGASSDGTKDYLKSIEDNRTKWVSEPDGGIYEAMNKGTNMSSGDYCLYLNAGDCFLNNHVLAKVSSFLGDDDFVLGNEVWVSKYGKIIRFFPSYNCFTEEHLFRSSVRHQATFIRRSVALQYPYDESLRLVSDWKFILERFLSRRHSFKSINVDICFFLDGGATQKFSENGVLEKRGVLETYPEYRTIWETPYNPSFMYKAICKARLYIRKLKYSRLARRMYAS